MGYSIRSLQWRLTMWQPFNTTTYLADWHAPPIAVELYDHRGENMSDFDSFELANVAADEAHADAGGAAGAAACTVQLAGSVAGAVAAGS